MSQYYCFYCLDFDQINLALVSIRDFEKIWNVLKKKQRIDPKFFNLVYK